MPVWYLSTGRASGCLSKIEKGTLLQLQRVPFLLFLWQPEGTPLFFRALCILLTGYIWATSTA